jgi:hypothetical protein
MKTRHNLYATLLLALGVTVAGCTSGDTAAGDDDDGGDGSGSGTQPVPTTPEGKFSVTSDFDIATNAPGTPGQILNYFIQATDDSDDPTKFIVDKLIEALPSGTVKNIVKGAAPFVTGYVNDRLLSVAPDFVSKIVEAGDKLGQITHHFGTTEVYEITAGGQATKTITGLHFKVDNVDLDFAFKTYNIPETKVTGLQVTLDKSGALKINAHTVGMKYGQVLKLAIDQAVVPMIDPTASNLPELLHNYVNCAAVGQYVFEAVGIGSASTFEGACNQGLNLAGTALYQQLDKLDTQALEFGLTGAARGVDKNKDGKMDDILTGTWSGTLTYIGQQAPLATAKFFGSKM